MIRSWELRTTAIEEFCGMNSPAGVVCTCSFWCITRVTMRKGGNSVWTLSATGLDKQTYLKLLVMPPAENHKGHRHGADHPTEEKPRSTLSSGCRMNCTERRKEITLKN
jgi:hypothetical protein